MMTTGLMGDFSGNVDVGRVLVHVFREVHFRRDTDGSWLIYVQLPEERDADGRYPNECIAGALEVEDGTINRFLDTLVDLVANPEAFTSSIKIRSQADPTPREID